MSTIGHLKDRLPPSVSIPLRSLLRRAKGMPAGLTHREVSRLLAKQSPTILEIGCNNGDDTLALLREMPLVKLYCFEPDPRAIRRFKENLSASLPRVTLTEVAVSDRNGTVDFYASSGGEMPEGWDQSGSIRKPTGHLTEWPWVKFEKTIAVETCRLDDWRADNGIEDVDFIWMDVQGAEGDVVAGATKTLERTSFLYTEYSDTPNYQGQLSLKELLARLPRFKVMARYPGDVLLRNRSLS